MGQHRDWNSDKRRDLARSTCSPLKRVAHAAREAKRNANRRERRAQNMAIVAVRKNACLCNENPDYCPRCDQETSHFAPSTSKPKASPWWYYNHCYEWRWEGDKFSQIFRWADSRRAEISLVELKAEILALGKSPAHAHAVFHLLLFYFPRMGSPEGDFRQAPKMTTAALQSSLQERGIEWRNKPKSLLTEIARRICTHGSFEAANKWSSDLCCNLKVTRDGGVCIDYRAEHDFKARLKDLDDGWQFEVHREPWYQQYWWTEERGYRPLRGIQDIQGWASETQRLFDAMWGPRFLETPQGRWVIGELVTTAVPYSQK
jgi:hypothetical protein